MKNLGLIMSAAFALTSCIPATNSSDSNVIIGKRRHEIKSGRLSCELMHQLGQVGDPQVSPDGKTVLYGVTYTGINENMRNRDLFAVGINGENKRQITNTPKSESNAVWINKGKKIAFIYQGQIWTMKPDGSARRKVSSYKSSIESFEISPDGKKALFVSTVKTPNATSVQHPDLNKATGRIIDDLMYKHWDEWTTSIPHPFLADFDGKRFTNILDLLDGEPYESPLRPFGGIEQLDFSPDGGTVAYTCRKKTGKDYSLSTNSDIFLYDIKTTETINLTADNGGYDTNPRFSPDGRYIAWLSMERDGYESDKNRLMVKDIVTDSTYYLTKNFDYDVNDFCWKEQKTASGENSPGIFFLSCVKGTTHIFFAGEITGDSSNNHPITPITDGQYDYASVATANGSLIALRHSISSPNEIYRLDPPEDGTAYYKPVNLSEENSDILSQITMGKVEERWLPTPDGEMLHTWVIYPPDFDPSKKYPALLYCQGGPQSAVSQFWSTRWNFQLMAAHGYIVTAPNRRGVTGFGSAWKEQISGDYGGLNMQDYLTAIDNLASERYVDEARLGCTGASYGGFSVYRLAGRHDGRFKAFWAHAGIFNLESQYLETEEMWFEDWDLGGPFWKHSRTTEKSYSESPHRFVDRWDTPIAVSHGELDYRILASQGMMAFNAAQL
ncbi:MAG: alpha/beta fold hydrolase, partial [Dysgonamonadaceae bacterium]|nr:alpha/beta fold hydrolase [Dysgonamonadaceae bacterium]